MATPSSRRSAIRSPTTCSSAPIRSSSRRCSSRDPATGRLQPDARLAWLFDFEAAVNVGLGVRIAIDPIRLRTGFERVIVLGLKLSADPAAGAALVEGLIESHRYTGGFDLLPQGTPTNNTERVPAGFSSDPRPTPTVYERVVQGKVAEVATDVDRAQGRRVSRARRSASTSPPSTRCPTRSRPISAKPSP